MVQKHDTASLVNTWVVNRSTRRLSWFATCVISTVEQFHFSSRYVCPKSTEALRQTICNTFARYRSTNGFIRQHLWNKLTDAQRQLICDMWGQYISHLHFASSRTCCKSSDTRARLIYITWELYSCSMTVFASTHVSQIEKPALQVD